MEFDWYKNLEKSKVLIASAEIKFEVGEIAASIEGMLSSDQFDVYYFEALKEQSATVIVHATENIASVSLYDSEGVVLAQDEATAELVLPESGLYFLAVETTDEEVAYELSLVIS